MKYQELARELIEKLRKSDSSREIYTILNGIGEDSYDVVQEILSILDSMKTELIANKNHAMKSGNSWELNQYREQIKKLKNLQNQIRTFRDDMLIKELSPEKRKNMALKPYLRRELSAYYDIFKTDYLIGELNLNVPFFEMEPEEKLAFLNRVRLEYECEKDLLKHRKNIIQEDFCKQILQDTGKNYKLQKRKLKDYLEEEKYFSYATSLNDIKIKRQKISSVLESIHDLINIQKELLRKKEKEQLRIKREDSYQKEQYVKSDDLYQIIESLKSESSELSQLLYQSILLTETKDKEEQLQFYLGCVDVLRKRLLFLKDRHLSQEEEKSEREQLKYYLFYFRMKALEHQVKKITSKDPYYPVMEVLLNEDRNYQYIKTLLEKVPELRSSRNENGHILCEILDRYIVNMKLKLFNQGIPFVDPKYYLKVWKTYFDYGNPLFKEEEEFLKERISEFREYIKHKKYAASEDVYCDLDLFDDTLCFDYKKTLLEHRKIDLNLEDRLEHIRHFHDHYSDLTPTYFKKINQKIEEYKNSFYRSYGEMPSNEMMFDDLKLNESHIDNLLFSPKVFTLSNDDSYAYSTYYDSSGASYIRFHILDIASIIDSDSKEDQLLKDRQLQKNENTFIFPRLEKGKVYPTLTLEVKIDPNGKINEMIPFKAMVEIEEVYGSEEVYDYRNYDLLKQLIAIFKKLNLSDEYFPINDLEDITGLTEEAINKGLMNMFEHYHIPYIYCNYPSDNEELILKNHNQTCYQMHKIPKEKAHQIFYILDEAVEKAYSIEPREDSHIETKPTTYLGLHLQRLLKQISSENYDLTLKNRFDEEEEIQSLILELNESLGYVPELQKRRTRKKRKTD